MTVRTNNNIVDLAIKDRNIKRLNDCTNAKMSDRMSWQCLACSHDWETRISKILVEKTGCPFCAGNVKLTNEIVDQKLLGRKIKRTGEYSGANSKIEWLCLVCDYTWEATPWSILGQRTGCPDCVDQVSLTNERIDRKIAKRPIRRVGNCAGAHTKILWQCLICNYEWYATPGNIINGKNGCPQCADNIRLTNEVIDQRLLRRSIKRIGDYTNSYTKLLWHCLDCNHDWEALPSNIVNQEKGCPKCNVPGIHEQLMHQLFEQHNFQYELQYCIKNIDVLERPLVFDAYFPKIKLAIEYNGRQHYRATGFFGSQDPEADFTNQKERDEHKRDFCKRSGIELIEIDGRKFYGAVLKEYLMSELIPAIKKKIGI